MDQTPAVAPTAFADAWPRAIETEIGAALCTIGAGKDFDFFESFREMKMLKSQIICLIHMTVLLPSKFLKSKFLQKY